VSAAADNRDPVHVTPAMWVSSISEKNCMAASTSWPSPVARTSRSRPRPTATLSRAAVRRVDSGPLQVGSEAIIKQPRLFPARWRVTELEPGRFFTWEATTGGVTTVGGHTVDADGQGSKITLALGLRGPFARLVYTLWGGLSRRYLLMEMEGFRQTAESVRD
jgi:hypothetical protein